MFDFANFQITSLLQSSSLSSLPSMGRAGLAGVEQLDFNMGEVLVQRFGITHLNDIKLELGFGKLRGRMGREGEEKNAGSRKQRHSPASALDFK